MENKGKKVVCPVEGKDGKTHWVKMGRAYTNRDSSINVYLDGLPINGRLQIRDWDDEGRDSPTERTSFAGTGAGNESPV